MIKTQLNNNNYSRERLARNIMRTAALVFNDWVSALLGCYVINRWLQDIKTAKKNLQFSTIYLKH